MNSRIVLALGCGLVIGYLIHSGVDGLGSNASDERDPARTTAVTDSQPPANPSADTAPVDEPLLAAPEESESSPGTSADGEAALDEGSDAPLEADQESAAPSSSDDAQSLIDALQNSDDRVRERALQQSIELGVTPPTDTLTELLRSDPAESVRALAFRLLTQIPDAEPYMIQAAAEIALTDSSASIRSSAQEVLDQIEQREKFGDEVEQPENTENESNPQ